MPTAIMSRRLFDQHDRVKQISVAAVTGPPLKQHSLAPHMASTKTRKTNSVSSSCNEKVCTTDVVPSVRKAKIGSGKGSVAAGQQQQQQQQQQQSPTTGMNVKYKTDMCHSVLANNPCPYGENCQYAHSKDELRERHHGVNYKTVKCQSFHSGSGVCNYGEKCNFLHDREDTTVVGGGGGGTQLTKEDLLNVSTCWTPTANNTFGGRISFGGGFGGSDGDSPVPSSYSGCDSPNSRSTDVSSEDWSLGNYFFNGGGGSAAVFNFPSESSAMIPSASSSFGDGFYFQMSPPMVGGGYPPKQQYLRENPVDRTMMMITNDEDLNNLPSYTGGEKSFFVKFHEDDCCRQYCRC